MIPEEISVHEYLVDLLYAEPGSALGQLATLFTRLDNISHVLAWAILDMLEANHSEELTTSRHQKAYVCDLTLEVILLNQDSELRNLENAPC